MENLQFSIDPSPSRAPKADAVNFDLLMAYGTYNAVGTYSELQVGCTSIQGPCDDSAPSNVNLLGSDTAQMNASAASLVAEGVYSEAYMPFAAAQSNGDPTNSRETYQESDNAPRAPELGSAELTGGQVLNAGNYLLNPVNGYQLEMQSDGNLVLYNASNTAVFSTGTSGHPGAYAIMQTDGNLVVYSSANAALYNTRTQGDPGAFFILQQDDSGVVYSSTGTPLFTTNTCLNCS